MAPEWKTIVDKDTSLEVENLKKLDVYAMGIILCDLICNPKTYMESAKIDDRIKSSKP
jgi:hypothetical protein